MVAGALYDLTARAVVSHPEVGAAADVLAVHLVPTRGPVFRSLHDRVPDELPEELGRAVEVAAGGLRIPRTAV